MMDNINLLTSSAFLHLGKATKFALLSVYETSSAFEVLSASCCLSHSPLRYRRDSPASPIGTLTGCPFILDFPSYSPLCAFVLRYASLERRHRLRHRYRNPLAFICSSLCLLCCAISSRTLSKSTGLLHIQNRKK